ncbi:MAG: polyprenyl synthetase family protein [Myxococcaceae bacterium]
MTPAPFDFVSAVESSVQSCLAAAASSPGAGGGVLSQAARHLCLGGGAKRMRPLLVRRVGELVGAPSEGLKDVAVAAELIHAASLLHDDVVDEGTLRRGQPCANVVFGNAVAVLAGDWLLSRAIGRLRPYPAAITFEAVDCIAQMAASAVAELEARGNAGLSLFALRSIAEGKTGALFAWCGRAAAHLAGREADAPALERFGRHLGVAFQMADDLKDLCDERGGKERFADLRAANPSFALAHAAQASPAFARALSQAWSRRPLEEGEVAELGRAAFDACARPAAAALEEELAAAAALAPLWPRAWSAHFAPMAEAFTRDLPMRSTP